MPRISVITDTDASISLSLSEKLSIQQVPIIIQFGEESFRAVYDIDDVKAFSRIDCPVDITGSDILREFKIPRAE